MFHIDPKKDVRENPSEINFFGFDNLEISKG